MAKRYTDTDIWKRQRWFKKLSPNYKLAFYYIKDMCDTIGVWKIDCSDLIEDTGIENFDLKDFIKSCNKEFDKINGKEVKKERVKMLADGELWITGFVQFQYENRHTGKVSAEHQIGGPAIDKLKHKNLFNEAVKNRYLVLNHAHSNGS